MKKYRYEFPSESQFRDYIVDEKIDQLDPDGFVADEATGDLIADAVIRFAGLFSTGEFEGPRETAGEPGRQRMLFWATEEDSENDSGENALGEITKTLVD